MNVWSSAARLASSSQCLHPTRLTIGKCSSSISYHITRHSSTSCLGDAPFNDAPKPDTSAPSKRFVKLEDDLAVKDSSSPSRRRRKRPRHGKDSREGSEKEAIKQHEQKKLKFKKPFDERLKVTLQELLNRIKDEDKPPHNHNTVSAETRMSPPHESPRTVVVENISEPSEEPILTDVAPISKHNPVETLEHGLDRVLFNPGVHWLRDPRSHVYNFTPWLEKIPKVNDFAFERLVGFISSSRDQDLRALAKQENKRFAGSTSSLSGMMSHIYFLLSEFKEADCTILSQHFKAESTGFTAGQRMPAMVKLSYKDGVYAIDSYSADYDDSDKNVLTWMGTLLENFLTKSPQQFRKFMRFEAAPEQTAPPIREAYRFAKSNNMVMRSQLDCHDKRLPGTGVFDIKTRACVTVRMDILNYEENAGYIIKSQHGVLESFEKEYYDLIRSAFLKYSFQVRIGNMDGVMVAYHNTERIFGFQYISIDEMDERLFGPTPGVGEKVFGHTVRILESVLEEAAKCFPDQSVVCGFETRLPGKVLDIYVQPADWTGDEESRPIQKLNVTVEHQLDGAITRAANAMRSVDEDWTVNYKISRVSLSDFELKADHKGFLNRKKRSLVLPSDVTLEQAEEYWTNLTFSNKIPEEKAKLFRPESFSVANAAIENYREISRKGRIVSQRLDERLAGRPKIILGHGIYDEKEHVSFKDVATKRESEE